MRPRPGAGRQDVLRLPPQPDPPARAWARGDRPGPHRPCPQRPQSRSRGGRPPRSATPRCRERRSRPRKQEADLPPESLLACLRTHGDAGQEATVGAHQLTSLFGPGFALAADAECAAVLGFGLAPYTASRAPRSPERCSASSRRPHHRRAPPGPRRDRVPPAPRGALGTRAAARSPRGRPLDGTRTTGDRPAVHRQVRRRQRPAGEPASSSHPHLARAVRPRVGAGQRRTTDPRRETSGARAAFSLHGLGRPERMCWRASSGNCPGAACGCSGPLERGSLNGCRAFAGVPGACGRSTPCPPGRRLPPDTGGGGPEIPLQQICDFRTNVKWKYPAHSHLRRLEGFESAC